MTNADFENMVVLHGNYLHPYAISLTQDREDAKDLYQETIMRALVNRDKYQFGTNLKAWLYTIMRNTFINSYRRNKKFQKVSAESSAEVHQQQMMTQNMGYSNLRLAEIKKAIENLPDIFRLSFELYYTGYKYHEIAVLLNEPLGTIKSRIHFARKMLVSKLTR